MLTSVSLARFFGTRNASLSDYNKRLQVQNKFNINLKPKIIAKHLLANRLYKNTKKMNLIKSYEKELEERKLQSIELGENENSFVKGMIAQLERTIADLKKQAFADRFFIEEIVYKILNEEKDHYETLTIDFLCEYVTNLPMTEFEREQYIKTKLGFEEMDYYFKSEKDLAFYLKNRRLPNEDDLQEYSIVDCSTQAVC